MSSGVDASITLTPEGKQRLEARALELRELVLPWLEALRTSGDPTADPEYRRLSAELSDIEQVTRHAILTDELTGDPQRIEVGDEVSVRFPDGSVETLLIVHPLEATLDAYRVSADAPLAKALIGRRVGEEVTVDAPGGRLRCTVEAARLRTGGGRTVARRARG